MSFGKGKTIVFLHGWGGSTDSFLGVARMLSRDYHLLLVDFAGFGKTNEPTVPYTLHDYTNDLDALLDDLDIKECFFVAHSFGGRVAIDYVTTKSRRILGMVLVDSAGLRPHRPLKYYVKVAKYKLKKRLHLDTKDMGSSDYRTLTNIMKATFVNVVNEHLDSRLKIIEVPTLIVWGKNDKDTPLYMARKLNRKIKGSGLIIFEDAGHFAYLEEGYRFYRIIESFVGGIN